MKNHEMEKPRATDEGLDVGDSADFLDQVEMGDGSEVAEVVEPAEPPLARLTAEDLGLELPDGPAEREAALLSELAAARSEGSEYLETLQRVAAEFDNYRKRVERDQGETVLRAAQRLVESILPTLDAFDAALAYDTQTPAEEKILDGMRGTHAQLMETLGREGLEPIAAEGTSFDPAVHEAVAGGGDGELVVARELRRGYTIEGRVVRPALVMVEETS